MASIQRKRDGWYCQFLYLRRRHTFALGKVDEAEAHSLCARVEHVLMRLKQGLMELPPGGDIVEFVRHDGRPPTKTQRSISATPAAFRQLREAYLATVGHGAIEANTLATVEIHLDHFARTLGDGFPMGELTLAHLQRHVDRRRKDVAGVTIRKEVDTLRTAWNWSARMGLVAGEFPAKGLVYPKEREKLPFMTREEIERRLKAGGDPEELWECLYLTLPEIEEFLAFVKARKAPDWFYPMILFAAHTGARRSELIRARAEDVDLAEGVVTIREKKRVKGKLTTRRVPLSETLAAELRDWLPGRISLFGIGATPRSVQGTQKAFVRAVKGSKWSVLKGYHTLRHAFVSALVTRGVDQRVIEELAGHMDEKTSRRYRHLAPSLKADALKSVFR
jgi:integrase